MAIYVRLDGPGASSPILFFHLPGTGVLGIQRHYNAQIEVGSRDLNSDLFTYI